jgi:hypothetical protein
MESTRKHPYFTLFGQHGYLIKDPHSKIIHRTESQTPTANYPKSPQAEILHNTYITRLLSKTKDTTWFSQTVHPAKKSQQSTGKQA